MSAEVFVYLEECFSKDAFGRYGGSANHGNDYWERYLAVYSRVNVVARVVPGVVSHLVNPITASRVRFVEVPYYKGPAGFIRRFPRLFFMMRRIVARGGSHILRLPGTIGSLAYIWLRLKNARYGVELVGDPDAVFGSGGVGGRFAQIYRLVFSSLTRLACKHSAAVSYVSREYLQKLYPPGPCSFATHFSSIVLTQSLLRTQREIRSYSAVRPFAFLVVGSLEQPYKGFDLMIRAVAKLRGKGWNVFLKIIGDGRFREELVHLAESLDVRNEIEFVGRVSRDSVLSAVDSVDLFVMPSRTEGLPRALIEAMARRTPAVGSRVGGIPELLEDDCLFPSEDVDGLTNLLEELIDNLPRRLAMAERNVGVAAEYELEALRARQNQFYSQLAALNT